MLTRKTFDGKSLSGYALFRVREGETVSEHIGVFPVETLRMFTRMLKTQSNNQGTNDRYHCIPVHSDAWEYDLDYRHDFINYEFHPCKAALLFDAK